MVVVLSDLWSYSTAALLACCPLECEELQETQERLIFIGTPSGLRNGHHFAVFSFPPRWMVHDERTVKDRGSMLSDRAVITMRGAFVLCCRSGN